MSDVQFTGEILSAREFSSRREAMDHARRCGITRPQVVRLPEMRNHPDEEGGFVVVDAERSRPCDPWYLG